MDNNTPAKYQRILLKISGEALMGQSAFGIDPAVLLRIADEVKAVVSLGVQLGMVIGGGNLVRGTTLSKTGIDRVTADHMGDVSHCYECTGNA